MPYKKGDKWVAQVRKTGRKREKIFQTKREAIAWEVEQKNLPDKEWEEKIPTACLIDWATKYLDYAKVKFSRKTFDEKRSMFKRFFKAVDPALPVDKLDAGQVLSYLQSQVGSRSGYAANKDRKNLVAAWNWGIRYFMLPFFNPCKVDRFPEERQPRYVPPEEDFWKVYEQADDDQDRLMLLAFLHTAARKSELLHHLKWENVDFAAGTIALATRKRADGTLEYDTLPLTDELYAGLLKHKQQSQSEWVFLNPVRNAPFVERKLWMPGLCARAGIKKFGVHAIRHLTASILAQAGEPTINIQAILRHKKISTTEKYLHRTTNLKSSIQIPPENKKAVGESRELPFDGYRLESAVS